MSSRVGLRFFQNSRAAFRNAQHRFGAGRRFQTSDAAAAEPQSVFQRLWNSPVGVKTVHFWAPVMKWALVIAGISDLSRPAEKLSLTQNGALTATGAIWTRWCLIITPKNYLLAAVNFFLGCVGIVQVGRIYNYHRSLEQSPAEAVKSMEHEVIDSAKEAVAKSEAAVEKSA
ncbi:hypothetical protein BDV35DRAFT_387465 [Aspergillus flavus]|uniref:Mitochondrial pyruvate carrier n=3 Tax=Aspergillus subgen. Circumdati TaxID=2720871 RepID=Q2UE26_ASPOR|nr:unnamed protein product [Aspergillus oryzae RIB40]KAB8252103.1 hypothetical protein BDV35DRAFT_387465 [Aspergillus flavus]OOO14578.1 UPF0041 domain-containing protein [Aspergillus oryzae]KAJ1713669.1 UPF0041 domain protein [Aspergillus flavus]QMW41875.1 hypothetical protein G4B11_005199 [Aspergillus flavus]RAQ65616.1 UPF0041 domain protein [Aspergillus flavus]